MDDQKVVDFVTELSTAGKSVDEIAKAIVSKSLELGTTDNLSVILIRLHKHAIA